jgi:hypothetical protein
VDLEQVDVRRVQALEGRFDLVEDRGAREPGLVDVVARVVDAGDGARVHVRVVAREHEALGEDEDAVARDVVLRVHERGSARQEMRGGSAGRERGATERKSKYTPS